MREPQPVSGLPRAPKWLKGEARKMWRFVLQSMGHTGVITQIDGPALAIFCREWQNYVQQNGDVSPQRIAQMRGIMAAFGMTPSDRTRLVMPFLKHDDDNEEERYFGT